MRKRTLLLLISLLAVLMALPLAGVWLAAQALQGSPSQPVGRSSLPQTREAPAVQRLFDRAMLRQLILGQRVRIDMPARDVNLLANDVAYRVLGGSAQVDLAQTGQASVWLSVPVQRTPLRSLASLGDWINIRALVAQTPAGPPQLVETHLGSLKLPPAWVQWGLAQAAAHYQLEDEVAVALKSVQTVELRPTNAAVALQLSPVLKGQALATLIPSDDLARMQAYQQALAQLLSQPTSPPGQVRLVSLLQPLFELAQQRSLGMALTGGEGSGDGVALHENRAALLVLAFYAVQVPLANVLPPTHDTRSWPNGPPLSVTLQGRGDFAQHFLLSSLLASGLGGRLADVIGIYKEIADTHGGSGFSFNDIAADRAGIRFGQRVRHAPVELQLRVAQGSTDDFFMPQVADLPEFLSAQDFQHRFEGPGKQAYDRLLAEIDRRIDALGVLR